MLYYSHLRRILMKKNVIILIAVLLAIAGGAAALLTSKSDEPTTDNSSSTQVAPEQKKDANNPLGIDTKSATEGPYTIHTTITTQGETNNATVYVDRAGNIKSVIEAAGQTSEFISIGDSVYSKTEATGWIKFPNKETASPDSLNSGLSGDDISRYNDSNIEDLGTGDCTAGTCRIYTTTDPASATETATIKVDTETNRISDVEITSAGGEVTVLSYDYSEGADITAPTDFTEFDINNIGELGQ